MTPGPIMFYLGPLEVRWYGVLVVTGAIVAAFVASREAARKGEESDRVWDILLWVLPAGLIGARLYHVISAWDLYKNDLLTIVTNWRGLAIYGAVAGGLIALWAYCRVNKLKLTRWMDIAAHGPTLGTLHRAGLPLPGPGQLRQVSPALPLRELVELADLRLPHLDRTPWTQASGWRSHLSLWNRVFHRALLLGELAPRSVESEWLPHGPNHRLGRDCHLRRHHDRPANDTLQARQFRFRRRAPRQPRRRLGRRHLAGRPGHLATPPSSSVLRPSATNSRAGGNVPVASCLSASALPVPSATTTTPARWRPHSGR
jgi:hypothetical protein